MRWLGQFVSGLTFVALTACASAPPPVENTIYLVRHAEYDKAGDGSLSLIGRTRAEILAQELAGAGLTAIYSTDYPRTQQTAGPISDLTGLPVYTYDAYDLEAFATKLRYSDGVILVVGHSNTTPELVAHLDGDPGPPINEAEEFDRIYILSVDGRKIRTLRRSYGR